MSAFLRIFIVPNIGRRPLYGIFRIRRDARCIGFTLGRLHWRLHLFRITKHRAVTTR